MRKIVTVLAAAAAVGVMALPGAAASSSFQFTKPVLLTPPTFGGYEPGIQIDKFGNIYVTAHKQNHGDAISPDPQSPTGIRSASWLWTSTDGQHFNDIPGLTPASLNNLDFGDEGDLALDGANHLYFVDTNVADVTFTQWTIGGPGKQELSTTRPVLPAGEPVDDRPWVAAHGNGVVMYAGNEGDKVTYPFGKGGSLGNAASGNAYGPGRYTVYMSYDGGQTFDTTGTTLNDSGWCHPLADPRAGSHTFYLICTNDGGANGVTTNPGDPGHTLGTLYAYVTNDDGHNWSRYPMGHYDAADPWTSWPQTAIGPDGSVWVLYVNSKHKPAGDPIDQELNGDTVTSSSLMLYHSTDGGRTWTSRDVTPSPGLVRYSWVGVAPNGTVGIAYYYRPNTKKAWYLYAGQSTDGGKTFDVTSAAPKLPVAPDFATYPFGDFFEIAYDAQNRMNIVFTVYADLPSGVQAPQDFTDGLNSDIYFVRQAAVAAPHKVATQVKGTRVHQAPSAFGRQLPRTGMSAALAALATACLFAGLGLRRRRSAF